MDASTLTNESRFNGLFIGSSGSGKKAAACTFPHPIKYFDMDGRVRGLLGSPWVERKGIDYKYYPPMLPNGKLVYKELNDDLEMLQIQAQTGKIPFKTIVVASITGAAYALLKDAVSLTHSLGGRDEKKAGKYIGPMAMPDPGDYGFVANGIRNILAFFRSLPGVNVIMMAHTIPKYAKPLNSDGSVNTYADSIVVGSKLSLTDKIGAEVPTGFDNVFEFSEAFNGNKTTYFVRFRGGIARTTYSKLPDGLIDVTGKNFYESILKDKLDTPAPVETGVPTNAQLTINF